MENQTNSGSGPSTERVTAPATPQYSLPRNKQLENMGGAGAPMVQFWPEVRGGICEACGVVDPNQPSQYQYKLCGHYRGMQLKCGYCPQTKDADDIIYHSTLKVAEHPDNPNKLVVWCNSYECSKKHIERFKVSA